MNKNYIETEIRKVSGFDQVSIKGNTCSTQIFITQGDVERLTIEAPLDYIHRLTSEVRDRMLTVRLGGNWLQELQEALANSLDRPHLIYRLEIREITFLEVQCAALVHLPKIETSNLRVKLNGIGDLCLDWLSAKKVEVYHAGSGNIRITGQVEEQTVVLNGLGVYIAPELESQRACVRISGTGMARINVHKDLDARLRGLGSLEYSGDAIVRSQISGPGQILKVAKASEEVESL